MTIKKVRERVHNGGTSGTESDWDTYYYETSEDMIVGQVQNLGRNGFRVFPGGLMEVWGETIINSRDYEAEVTVTLPVEVVNPIFDIHLTKSGNTNAVDLTVKKVSDTAITIKGMALARGNGVSTGIGAVPIFFNFKTTVKSVGEGSSVPSTAAPGNSNTYVHPATHPASMITGLAKVATSGDYADLINQPTKLSEFQNDIGVGGGNNYNLPIASETTLGGVKIGANLSISDDGVLSAINNGNGANITITNTLDNYSGATLNDKMVAMFNDINTNHKNTPMAITLPSGIIEITQDLTAIGWTNKVFKGECILYFKNCNAIEFKQCQHNDIYIHRVSSAIPSGSSNPQGFINPNDVAKLTKRGIKITDCSYNKFEFNTILGFTNAIEVYSEYGALGSFYNNIYFTAIWRCQRPITFKTGKATDDTAGQSGWITEIFIHGGMFDCDDGVLVGQELADRPNGEPSDNYQGLKFYNLGVEHVRKKENGKGIYFLQGKNNAVINPRFEGSMGNGNATSGAYILVEESGYACNNRIETSNYPLNVDRVKLNHLAKQLVNTNYDNPAGSYIEGDLYDTSGFKCGYKAIATPGKMVYEAKNLSNYYLDNAKNNTFNYTYSNTEFAKVKGDDGVIRTIGYKS